MPSGPERPLLPPEVRLALARVAFLLVVGPSIGLLIALVPIHVLTASFDWQIEATYPAIARYMTQAAYAGLRGALSYVVALVCVVVGAAMGWRKADEPVAWLGGALLVSLPLSLGLGGYSDTWDYYPAAWRAIFIGARDAITFGSVIAFVLFVYLFPNGKLPMRWLRWPAVLYVSTMTVLAVGVVARLEVLVDSEWLYLAYLAAFLLPLPLGLAGQWIRYRRLSTPLERQQTKWVVLGLAFLVSVILVDIGVQIVTADKPSLSWLMLVLNLLMLLSLAGVPVTLAFSILRYRLWDIDRLIHRGLLYGILSVALAGLYLGSVIVLQSTLRAITGQGQSPLVTVLSTLLIAAAAGPLRSRVQTAIDRRFNRRRYDAARTLAAFALAMRDNSVADLDRLNNQLVGVVQDTLEPEKVSLWLRQQS
jgi:hypothetical protein